MNIFVLDNDIRTCAKYHCDKHVVKMILESAQMLCAAFQYHGIDAPYKIKRHLNHPCTKWARESLSNWIWLRGLALALNNEFKYRYNKGDVNHKSVKIILDLPKPPLLNKGLTVFAQAMLDKYKVPGNVIQAYRNYYIGEKVKFATWKKRNPPDWFLKGIKGD